ncbi:hypothetical protein [Pseudomonas kilonensis]|uniref:hypothetical protein n=1 Tax=Pseudomonas kilonensis TaxID=132476 RepID=UPI0012E286D2|nr:hypothetical protein [Pseudomonas kilonensis]
MSIQYQLKSALFRYLEFGDSAELFKVLSIHPEIISEKYGEYPDVHQLIDLRVGGRGFRVCRQISQGELITLVSIEEVFDTPGVPLWLTGEKLVLWAIDEKESPSDEPTDWSRYC